jgi:anti-sigma factor RsiW
VSCEKLLDLLLDYVGGELVVEQHQSVEIHLAGCDKCLMLVKSYRYTIRLARALPKCEPLPAAVEARLREVLAPHLGGDNPETE